MLLLGLTAVVTACSISVTISNKVKLPEKASVQKTFHGFDALTATKG